MITTFRHIHDIFNSFYHSKPLNIYNFNSLDFGSFTVWLVTGLEYWIKYTYLSNEHDANNFILCVFI